MAEDQEPTGPSLEPPTLFGRKKKKTVPAEPPGEESATTLDERTAAPGQTPAREQPTLGPGPRPTAPPSLFVDEAAPTETLEGQAPLQSPVPAPVTVSTPPRPPKPPRTGPPLPGRVAAGLAGLLVGGLVVGLTSASFELCSRVQGTSSCGGPGIFLLLAILVLGVVVGTLVLRLCQVPEPGSTSFLAVGLTSVVALLFLIEALFEWWMVIVIPLVSVATFLLSHWVTTTFVEPAGD